MLRFSRLGLIMAASTALGAAGLNGCGEEGEPTNNTSEEANGTGEIALSISGSAGAKFDAVSYVVTGTGSFVQEGTLDVSASTTISGVIGGLPAAVGYSIALSATSLDGQVSCAGSASFAISAGKTTSVTVHLGCHEAPRTGSALVNGQLNICPTIDVVSALPSEVLVGGTVALTGSAHDSDNAPSPVSYKWTTTSGTLSDSTSANPVFTCTTPGVATLTLTASDGDSSATCAATQTVSVTCTGDFSFVVMGCNRVDPTDPLLPAGTDLPSTANLAQLDRTFAEVAKLDPLPDYFFFAGDLVMGYTDDNHELNSELQAWVDHYRASPLYGTKVRMVALPGNHETQSASKISTLLAEQTWLNLMDEFIVGANGEQANDSALDNLQTDQSKLSYSFDHNGSHFVVLNTDPVGADWTVPVKWVQEDAMAARAAGAKHIFAIGHKPAYGWPGAVTDSLLGKGFTGGGHNAAYYQSMRDQFWNILEANHAEAMFSAHNHLWYKQRPNKTWQITAGNGGSPLETTVVNGAAGIPAYFGFTLVNVKDSGSVTVSSYGRDVPTAGYWAPAPESLYPTTVRDFQDITWN